MLAEITYRRSQIDELRHFQIVHRDHRLTLSGDDQIRLLRPNEVDVPCGNTIDVTPCEICFLKLGFHQGRFTKVYPPEVRPREVGIAEARPGEVRPPEVRPHEVGRAEVGPPEVRLAEVGPQEDRSPEVRSP